MPQSRRFDSKGVSKTYCQSRCIARVQPRRPTWAFGQSSEPVVSEPFGTQSNEPKLTESTTTKVHAKSGTVYSAGGCKWLWELTI